MPRLTQAQAELQRVSDALTILRKAGFDEKVMKSYLRDTTKISMGDIEKMLDGQKDFFRAIGATRK